jgi:hypothetical protein
MTGKRSYFEEPTMPGFIRKASYALLFLLMAAPASAQVVQSVQFGVGGVFPRGLDARAADDILVRNYFGESLPGAPDLTDALAFDISDFRSGQLFGEWNVAFGDHIEFGAGVGVYGRTVPTVYYDLVDEQGLEIEQRLRLRVVPVTGLVRFLPFGRAGSVQPYVGAGISALNFRYSETGQFVDGETLDVFDDHYSTSGTALGGLVLGGIRFPLGGDIYAFGIEGRYQFGQGNTGGAANRLLADKIDLGAAQLNFTFLVRF